MVDEKIKFLLLKSIESNLRIDTLINIGYSYLEISQALSQLLNSKYITTSRDGAYKITTDGEVFVNKFKKSNKFCLIEPYWDYKRKKKDIYDIFIE